MTTSTATPPPSREYAPGDLIASKYLLGHVIGSGGMGTVWAATNQDLGLEVALKVVNPGADHEEISARLAIEARAEAKLQHPGIVRVIDLGITEHGEPFLVMERLEGESLASLLERVGRFSPRAAVRLMLPVIDALRFAHSRNVIHRDLKPDNIFLSLQAGRVQPKIVDFGIAKLGDATVCRRRTGRGAVVGSPGYMAPEHARGKEVDHRADIFTACLVLYECITGTAAFEGDSYNALLRAVIEQELPPITWFGFGDPVLSAILERGLRKDPAKRFASCEELGRALATWLAATGETEDVSGAPVVFPTSAGLAPRRHGGKMAFAALILGGFLVGFAATTSVDDIGRKWLPTNGSKGASLASAVPAAGAVQQTTAREAEPVVRVLESPPTRVDARRAGVNPARVATSGPVLPHRRAETKTSADATLYPVPRAPAFALPSEPALMSVANAATTRTDLKDPYQ